MAIGFLNVCIGLPTGMLLWVVLNGYPWVGIVWLPVVSVLWFTGAVTILGILMQEVLLLKIYSKCWRFLYYWLKGGN